MRFVFYLFICDIGIFEALLKNMSNNNNSISINNKTNDYSRLIQPSIVPLPLPLSVNNPTSHITGQYGSSNAAMSLILDDPVRSPLVNQTATSPNDGQNVNNSNNTKNKKKRRNRLSFVCQACRQAKSKCDKEKPECSRCEKLGIQCIYDTAIQPLPKNLSKDLAILRLENEVDYWQKKTKLLLEEQQNLLNQYQIKNKHDKNCTKANIITDKNNSNNNNTNNCSSDSMTVNTILGPIVYNDQFFHMNVYLGERNPRLIMSKFMKREVNPLSANYLMINDVFFAMILMSIFIDPTILKGNILKNNIQGNNISNGCNDITNTIHNTNERTSESMRSSIGSTYCELIQNMNADHLVSALIVDITMATNYRILKDNIYKLQKILIDRCQSNDFIEIKRIKNFCNRIIELSSEVNDITDVLKNWINPNVNDHLEDILNLECNSDNGGTPSVDHSIKINYEQYYSPLLKQIIQSFENLLPPLHIIEKFKRYFYENLYPLVPFVDLTSFENSLQKILVADPTNNEKCKLILGVSGIRNKIETLSILSCILKISYLFFCMLQERGAITENVVKKYISLEQLQQYPIKNDIIVTVLRCLISENWTKCPNENIITILLYLWSFFIFTPDEGNFFAPNPTEFICDTIIMLSIRIGLHRDPKDYSPLDGDDHRLLRNHRRLLWLSVLSMSSYENASKGRRVSIRRLLDSFIDIYSPNAFENYMERVHEDLVYDPSLKEFMVSLHELVWKRTKLALLHQKLNNLTMCYNKRVSLWDIERAMSSIDTYCKEYLNVSHHDIKIVNAEKHFDGKFYDTNVSKILPEASFISKLLTVTLQVRTSYALMLHFENLGDHDTNDKNGEDNYGIGKIMNEKYFAATKKQSHIPYYLRYLRMTIKYCLKLIELYEDFYYEPNILSSDEVPLKSNNGTNIPHRPPYHVSKFLQVSLSTTMFTLLVIIVRIAINEIFLSEDNEYGKNDKKIDSLMVIQNILRARLKRVHDLVTCHLKYSYFSVFKILSLYNLLIHRIVCDKLMNGLFKPITERDVDPRMAKFFKMSFNIKFSDGDAKFIDILRDKNHISLIDENSLIQLLTELKNNHRETTNLYFDFRNSSGDVNASKTASNEVIATSQERSQLVTELVPGFVHSTTQEKVKIDNKINTEDISGILNVNLEMPNNDNQFNAEASCIDQDIVDPYNDSMFDEEQLSKTFTGIFGDLDLFDYDYFFSNNNSNV